MSDSACACIVKRVPVPVSLAQERSVKSMVSAFAVWRLAPRPDFSCPERSQSFADRLPVHRAYCCRHTRTKPLSDLFEDLADSDTIAPSGFKGDSDQRILTFCRRSKILRAERFHIAVAQAVERQPCQGKFLRERSKNRFPLGLIRFPRSDVVEAFSRLLVIF